MVVDWQSSQADPPTAASPEFDALGTSVEPGVIPYARSRNEQGGETRRSAGKTSSDPSRMGTDCYRKVRKVISLEDILSPLPR